MKRIISPTTVVALTVAKQKCIHGTLKFIDFCNLPKHICCHLFGDEHPHSHRVVVGFIVIICGMGVAHAEIGPHFLRFTEELIGYTMHGLGLHQFIESIKPSKT
jgi:hypothetical protein